MARVIEIDEVEVEVGEPSDTIALRTDPKRKSKGFFILADASLLAYAKSRTAKKRAEEKLRED